MSWQTLIWRQAMFAVGVGLVIYLSKDLPTALIYAAAFYAISTPLAIWVERRRARD